MGFIAKIFGGGSPKAPKPLPPPEPTPEPEETSTRRRRRAGTFRGTLATSTLGTPGTGTTLRPTLG